MFCCVFIRSRSVPSGQPITGKNSFLPSLLLFIDAVILGETDKIGYERTDATLAFLLE